MPTSASVLEQLTDIVVSVLGCPADAVVPGARLTDLGSDSLTIVEIGEELGRRFDVYLSDDTIDRLVTVQDAVQAVTRHDGSMAPPAPPPARPVPAAAPAERNRARSTTSAMPAGAPESPGPLASLKPSQDNPEHEAHIGRMLSVAIALGLVGAIVGAAFGLGGAALVGATGISSVDLPPLVAPTTPAPTPTPTPTPKPAPPTDSAEPEPTLEVNKSKISPGERVTLSGVFPALGKGETLQVQARDKGGSWDDFPVDTRTRDGGTYETQIYTSRTGERELRMLHKKTDKASPAVTVEIG